MQAAATGDRAQATEVALPTAKVVILDDKENQENCAQKTDEVASSMKKEVDALQGAAKLKEIKLQVIRNALKENAFFIENEKVQEILRLTGFTIEELLQELVPLVKVNARPQISKYYVGVVGLFEDGDICIGVNLEFFGFQLNQCVHGEQFLIANAIDHQKKKLVMMALSAAPCGHCRQFLNELGYDVKILTPPEPSSIPETPDNNPSSLNSLLPKSFGPKDLGKEGGLLTPEERSHSSNSDLIAKAIEAACHSYSPYTDSPAGVAIRTKDGTLFSGGYLENVAYNPGLPPLQAALVAMVAAGYAYDEIAEVVLAELKSAPVKNALVTKALVESLAPEAKFHLECLEKLPKNEK